MVLNITYITHPLHLTCMTTHTHTHIPDDSVLSCAPERVWPHGGGGNALHSVGVIGEHVDRFLHRHVMNVNLRVCSSGNQDPISRVWQKLQTACLLKTFKITELTERKQV